MFVILLLIVYSLYVFLCNIFYRSGWQVGNLIYIHYYSSLSCKVYYVFSKVVSFFFASLSL